MRGVALVAFALVALSACTYSADRADDPYRPRTASSDRVDGRELYLGDCAWCHGRRGGGTERGPDLVSGTNGPALVDFVLSTGRMPIADPDARMRPGDPFYTRAQIDAIVEWSRELGAAGPDVPEVDLAGADLPHGNELYQENCAACHSTTGIGGALTRSEPAGGDLGRSSRSSFIAPSLLGSNPVEVVEAIRTGPGNMPVFGVETFATEDVEAIAAYVEHLQDPPARGGADAGRIGPVAEGAIGWILGLGLLLALTRWMGTRRGEP